MTQPNDKDTPPAADKVKRNNDKRFDISLGKAELFEQEFSKALAEKKLELKTEVDWWQKTGNICIEFWDRGKPSGISTTEADYWVQELRDKDGTVCYLVFPTPVLKKIMDKSGRLKEGIGDDRGVNAVLIPLKNIFDHYIRKAPKKKPAKDKKNGPKP